MADRSLFAGSFRSRFTAAQRGFCLLAAALGLACQPQIGDECQTSVDCSQGGERLCDITQPGGYCTVFGCEPESCPEESACLAFGTQVSSLAECTDTNGLSRFTRSFCLASCESNDDCRGGYVCADVREPPWNALLVDRRGSGRVCVVPPSTEAEIEPGRPAELCTGPRAGSGGAGGSAGTGGTAGTDAAGGAMD